jgi:DNA-binding MarR family transcriptional regulator
MDIRGFRRVLRKFEQTTGYQANTCCLGVTVPQCHALLEIEFMGETTIGGLAERLDLDKSTLSRTVEGLVRLGLVERLPNPQDRRYMIVKLSEKGQQTCDSINKVNDEFYRQVIESIPAAKREDVLEAIQIFAHATQAQITNTGS